MTSETGSPLLRLWANPRARVGGAVAIVAAVVVVIGAAGGGGGGKASPGALSQSPDAQSTVSSSAAPSSGAVAPAASGTAAPRTSGSARPRTPGPGGSTSGATTGSTPTPPKRDGHGRVTTVITPPPSGRPNPWANLAMGRGVTKTSITLGIAYQKAGSQLGVAYGGQEEGQAKALVAFLNKNGGIAGRQIKPVYYGIDPNDHNDPGTKACTAFTQDATVFAAISNNALNSYCLAKHQTVALASQLGPSAEDASSAQYGDYTFGPSGFSEERAIRAYVDGLFMSGYFNGGNRKIGMVTFGSIADKIVPIVRAALGAHGLSLCEGGSESDCVGQAADDASNTQQIVLKMKTNGVTHVLTPDYSPVLMMTSAESQQYRPRWGLNSSQNPSYIASSAPAAQMASSALVSWLPHSDVGAAQDPGDLGTNSKLCRQVMAAQGQPTDRTTMSSAYQYCDSFFVLKTALESSSALTAHGFRLAYEQIGAWDSPVTFKARLVAGHHDGANGFRLASYGASCKCFAYTGPVVSF